MGSWVIVFGQQQSQHSTVVAVVLAARSTAAGKVWAAVIEQLNPTDRGGVGGTAQAGSPTIIIHPTLKLKNIES